MKAIRLWENLVGRSRAFWDHWYAPLQVAFPDALRQVDADTFYRAINKVAPSLIRTQATK
jgi:carboxypeptidase Taq